MEPLGERKKAILSAVIEAYIRTGEPVGSKLLAQQLDNAVSSATIRNEMAELAGMGYLEQPHTSAGRIPTAKAFRLYIDRLMTKHPLDAARQQVIDEQLSKAAGDPERLLGEASQLLSSATGCAALTTAPTEQANTLRQIEFVRMSARTLMLVLMTASGTVRNRLCRIDADVDDDLLRTLYGVLCDTFAGQPLADITLPQLQQTLLLLGGDSLRLAGVLTAFYELVREAVEADVLLTGQLKLLESPDYQWEHARLLLSFLSQRERLAAMLQTHAAGLQVLLGSESLCPELNGSSVIVTRYSPDGHSNGTLGLIGPIRMDYANAIPELEYMAKTMERLMADLW